MANNMLSNQSQLLLRSEDHFSQGNWAFINPTEAEIFNQIDNPQLIGLHQLHHHFSECERFASQPQHFGAAFGPVVKNEFGHNLPEIAKGSFDGVVIYMPKSKQHLSMLIDNASYLVKKDALVLIVGENGGGIKSVPKMLEKIGTQVNKVDSAKHCGLYAVTVSEPLQSFDIHKYSITQTYTINEQTLKVYSLPGVFGHKQLDPGTALLLAQLTPAALAKTKGHVYDFACGTGIIACYLAKAIVKTKRVSMSDVSALAVFCSEQTVALNEVDAKVIACDGLARLDTKFDYIVSNPPFHAGMKNDYSITENFIKQAFSQSHQYASITIVANRFLPYQDILEEVYKECNEIAATAQYRVYAAKKFTRA